MIDVEKKVKYGITAALSVPAISSSSSALMEPNMDGIRSLPEDALTSESVELIYSYLGFCAAALVRLVREHNLSKTDIVRTLSKSNATSGIIPLFANVAIQLEWSYVEPYFNALVDYLIPKRTLVKDVPQDVNDSDFIEYVLNAISDVLSSMTKLNVNTYDIEFEKRVPAFLSKRTFPQIAPPCELRSPQDMPYVKNPYTGRAQRLRSPDFIDIVDTLVNYFGLCTVGECKTIVVYDRTTGHYESGMQAVNNIISKYVYRRYDLSMSKNVANYLAGGATIPNYPVLPKNYVIMNNCVVDVEKRNLDGTFKCYPLSASWVSAHYYPVDYNPDADVNFVYSVLHNGIACKRDDVYQNLIEIPAFILYQRASGYLFMLHNEDCRGDASNGKSTYLDLCRALCKGRYTSLDIQECGGSQGKYNTADLENSLCNIGEDLSNMMANSEALSKVKALVTGGETSSHEKFVQGSRNITSIAQHIYACNMMPRFSTDDGFNRRFHLVPMNAHFSPDDPDFVPDMSARLLGSEENIQAFALLALNRLSNMFETNNFKPTQTPESLTMKMEFKVDNSAVLQWVEDRGYSRESITYRGYQHPVVETSDYYPDELLEVGTSILRLSPSTISRQKVLDSVCVMSAADYYMDYKIWCSYRGYSPKSVSQFKKEIQSVLNIRKQVTTTDGKKEQSSTGFHGKQVAGAKRVARQFFRLVDTSGLRFACETENRKLYYKELELIADRLTDEELDIHKSYCIDKKWYVPTFLGGDSEDEKD